MALRKEYEKESISFLQILWTNNKNTNQRIFFFFFTFEL